MLDNQLFEDDFDGSRDHLILELFYGTGMRLSELIGLSIQHVDIRNLQLKVTGKRNKQRIIPLFPSLANQLSKFIDERNAIEET